MSDKLRRTPAELRSGGDYALRDKLGDGWIIEGIETTGGRQTRIFLRRGKVLKPKWFSVRGHPNGGFWASKYRKCRFSARRLADT